MRLRASVLIVPLLLVLAAPGAAQDAVESRAVYESVLDSIRHSGRASYFVAGQTATLLPADRWQSALLRASPGLSAELVARLVARNAASVSLPPEWLWEIGTAPEDPLLEDRSISPTWRVAFSQVAFSTDQSTALVYVVEVCGGRCGAAGVVRLRKRQDRWRIDRWTHLMRF